MKQPYLVQRGRKVVNEDRKGIDSIVTFDYMGSSEYEWGTLPKSLKKIRKNIKNYTTRDLIVGGCGFTAFGPRGMLDNLPEYIHQMIEGRLCTKGHHRMNYILYGDNDFWWDLTNNIMWWIEDKEFEDKFSRLIL